MSSPIETLKTLMIDLGDLPEDAMKKIIRSRIGRFSIDTKIEILLKLKGEG